VPRWRYRLKGWVVTLDPSHYFITAKSVTFGFPFKPWSRYAVSGAGWRTVTP
jgi:hypothetical protein